MNIIESNIANLPTKYGTNFIINGFFRSIYIFSNGLDQFHIKRFEDYVRENKDFANMIIKYIADNYVCFYDADYKLGKIDQEKVQAYFEQHVNDVEYFRNGKLVYGYQESVRKYHEFDI
jgi:hypothetical protein